MGSKLHGERMELPEMGPSSTASSIPAPPSIAPVGFDVRPLHVAPAKGLSVGTFVAGAMFGTVLTGIVALALHATQPATTSPQALLAALPPVVAAAPPPVILAPPSVGPASDGPSASAPLAAASPSTTDESSAGAQVDPSSPVKKGKSAPRRVPTHKAKDGVGGGSSLGASSGDDAFMKAIRASSH